MICFVRLLFRDVQNIELLPENVRKSIHSLACHYYLFDHLFIQDKELVHGPTRPFVVLLFGFFCSFLQERGVAMIPKEAKYPKNIY